LAGGSVIVARGTGTRCSNYGQAGRDDGRLIVRGYETEGRPARLTITSEQLQRKWSYDVGPHEIWTLSLSLDGDEITPLNLLEDPLL
jgi:hypothetical protein